MSTSRFKRRIRRKASFILGDGISAVIALIVAENAKPRFAFSHQVSLEKAPDAYVKFDKRVEGFTKVILNP